MCLLNPKFATAEENSIKNDESHQTEEHHNQNDQKDTDELNEQAEQAQEPLVEEEKTVSDPV